MRKQSLAFTRIELLVVVSLCGLLVLLLLPNWARGKSKAQRISCVSNLKHIGISYRVWAGENSGQFPAQATNAGWMEVATSTNAARFCWTNYVLMANPLGQRPTVLICPSDERRPAVTLVTNLSRGIGNTNISYFVGVDSSDSYPQAILGGDRNLAPGPQPSNDYGFSPVDGRGADVVLSTNATVCWSLKMHSGGNAQGAGNIVLADGSAQQCNTARFRTDYLPYAQAFSIWPPRSSNTDGSFRLIFP